MKRMKFEITSRICAHIPEEYKTLKTIVRVQWVTMNLDNTKDEIIKFVKNDLNEKILKGGSSKNEDAQHALCGGSDNSNRKRGKC